MTSFRAIVGQRVLLSGAYRIHPSCCTHPGDLICANLLVFDLGLFSKRPSPYGVDFF